MELCRVKANDCGGGEVRVEFVVRYSLLIDFYCWVGEFRSHRVVTNRVKNVQIQNNDHVEQTLRASRTRAIYWVDMLDDKGCPIWITIVSPDIIQI